jgi:prevent-host-death family protein
VKFVSSRDLRINPGAIWKRLREEKDLVITSNGKPVGVLTFADEDSLEDVLTTLRQGRALSAAARIRQNAARKRMNQLSDHDIETIIQRTRALRRKAMAGGKR